jgi:hypothetical protein
MNPHEIECPNCGAPPLEVCEGGVMHLERRDEVGDPGPLAVLDWDNDGVSAGLDIDDPAGWL